ncbi:Endonuclease/exonuclease/phosphatase, partial [Mycena rosella]
GTSKWADISRMMYDEKLGLLAGGELHLHPQSRLLFVKYPRPILLRHFPRYHPNAAGVGVILNKDIVNIEGVKTWELIKGQALLVQIPWHKSNVLTALAVYAPADSMASNRAFWEELDNYGGQPDIILGDMNIVEDAIDRLPHREDDDGATNALANFKHLLGLKDGWRVTNPDEKTYTFTSTASSHSRLDRIYVSNDLYKKCRRWEISDAAGRLSDHRMVSVDITAPGAPFIGEGRYIIPTFLMKDKKLLEFAVSEGCKL